MKERITFIQPAAETFSPEQFKVSPQGLRIKSVEAAREVRLTFGVEELPHEVRSLEHYKSVISFIFDGYRRLRTP